MTFLLIIIITLTPSFTEANLNNASENFGTGSKDFCTGSEDFCSGSEDFCGGTKDFCGGMEVMYRLTLSDKGHAPYSIGRPEEFLSGKAVERRRRQGLAVDSSDLPIDPAYFQALEEMGARVRASSKWVGTITVSFSEYNIKNKIEELPFVQSLTPVWKGDFGEYAPLEADTTVFHDFTAFSEKDYYGKSFIQNGLINIFPLHKKGIKGKGMTIAVIDGGFYNADRYPNLLDTSRIRGSRNFTHRTGEVFRNSDTHGVMTLSCLLANASKMMVGTAPEADFYLFQTEVSDEEFPVEEDYWVAALEYADSLGVDVVSSSLGYISFDDSTMNHRPEELDGWTIPASRAASMAAGKGMLLFHSVGNVGDEAWQRASVPSDARNIVTVGAVDADSVWSYFSSWGMLEDGRIKPDVVAMGEGVCVFHPAEGVVFVEGTSFSTPVLAGAGACLWGALPSLTAAEVAALLIENADRNACPDAHYGYGIPNVGAAYFKKMDKNGCINIVSTQQSR
jgi:subtilisin family serine protease